MGEGGYATVNYTYTPGADFVVGKGVGYEGVHTPDVFLHLHPSPLPRKIMLFEENFS